MSKKREGLPFDRQGPHLNRRQFLGLSATAAAGAAVFLAGWGGGTRTAFASPNAPFSSANNVLTIVHTNDVHGYVDVLPYAKGFMDELSEAGETPLLISAGDDFAGTTFASLSKGKDVATAMNMTGYNLATIGNHEYMMDPLAYRDAHAMLTFPILACNVIPSTLSSNPSIQKYQIVECDGAKIAVIGIAYNQIGAPDLIASIEAAKVAAEAEGATAFIGISHLGLTDPVESNKSSFVADKCPWFTAIIDGHSHTELSSGQMRNGVLIVQTGEYGNNIGVTEITFDEGVVSGASAWLLKIKGNESACGITPDADVKAFIKEVNDRNYAYLSTVLFTLPVKLAGNRGLVRTSEAPIGNFVADAMRTKAGTDIALATGASLRNDLGPDAVTRENLFNAILGESLLARIEMKGSDLLRILELGLGLYPVEYFLFPHISGVRIAFDSSKPAGERIVYAALVDGTRIDAAGKYSCTVREDLVSVYLSGKEKYIEGVDYFADCGSQLDAIVDYGKSEALISGDPDGRLRLRGASYALNFDGNGAESGSLDSVTLAYDEEFEIPPNPYSLPEHEFGGWLDAEGILRMPGDKIVNLDVSAAGETVLAAQWEQVAPPVPSDPDGSGGAPSNPGDPGGTPAGPGGSSGSGGTPSNPGGSGGSSGSPSGPGGSGGSPSTPGGSAASPAGDGSVVTPLNPGGSAGMPQAGDGAALFAAGAIAAASLGAAVVASKKHASE